MGFKLIFVDKFFITSFTINRQMSSHVSRKFPNFFFADGTYWFVSNFLWLHQNQYWELLLCCCILFLDRNSILILLFLRFFIFRDQNLFFLNLRKNFLFLFLWKSKFFLLLRKHVCLFLRNNLFFLFLRTDFLFEVRENVQILQKWKVFFL